MSRRFVLIFISADGAGTNLCSNILEAISEDKLRNFSQILGLNAAVNLKAVCASCHEACADWVPIRDVHKLQDVCRCSRNRRSRRHWPSDYALRDSFLFVEQMLTAVANDLYAQNVSHPVDVIVLISNADSLDSSGNDDQFLGVLCALQRLVAWHRGSATVVNVPLYVKQSLLDESVSVSGETWLKLRALLARFSVSFHTYEASSLARLLAPALLWRGSLRMSVVNEKSLFVAGFSLMLNSAVQNRVAELPELNRFIERLKAGGHASVFANLIGVFPAESFAADNEKQLVLELSAVSHYTSNDGKSVFRNMRSHKAAYVLSIDLTESAEPEADDKLFDPEEEWFRSLHEKCVPYWYLSRRERNSRFTHSLRFVVLSADVDASCERALAYVLPPMDGENRAWNSAWPLFDYLIGRVLVDEQQREEPECSTVREEELNLDAYGREWLRLLQDVLRQWKDEHGGSLALATAAELIWKTSQMLAGRLSEIIQNESLRESVRTLIVSQAWQIKSSFDDLQKTYGYTESRLELDEMCRILSEANNEAMMDEIRSQQQKQRARTSGDARERTFDVYCGRESEDASSDRSESPAPLFKFEYLSHVSAGVAGRRSSSVESRAVAAERLRRESSNSSLVDFSSSCSASQPPLPCSSPRELSLQRSSSSRSLCRQYSSASLSSSQTSFRHLLGGDSPSCDGSSPRYRREFLSHSQPPVQSPSWSADGENRTPPWFLPSSSSSHSFSSAAAADLGGMTLSRISQDTLKSPVKNLVREQRLEPARRSPRIKAQRLMPPPTTTPRTQIRTQATEKSKAMMRALEKAGVGANDANFAVCFEKLEQICATMFDGPGKRTTLLQQMRQFADSVAPNIVKCCRAAQL